MYTRGVLSAVDLCGIALSHTRGRQEAGGLFFSVSAIERFRCSLTLLPLLHLATQWRNEKKTRCMRKGNVTKRALGQAPASRFSAPHFHFLSISTLSLASDLNFSLSTPSSPNLFLSSSPPVVSFVRNIASHHQFVCWFCCLFIMLSTRLARSVSGLRLLSVSNL